MQATLSAPSTGVSRLTGTAPRNEPLQTEPDRCQAQRHSAATNVWVIGGYISDRGSRRQVVCERGASDTVLVIDEDVASDKDRRLLAHLSPDEPQLNAQVVCDVYLSEPPERRVCRQVSDDDLQRAPTDELESLASEPEGWRLCNSLAGRAGEHFELGMIRGKGSIDELRWLRRRTLQVSRRRLGSGSEAQLEGLRPDDHEPVSVRDVVGSVESYEPVRTMTAQAIVAYRADRAVSVVTITAEFERLNASQIVLNRDLRERVLCAVRRGALSMSEIALRCGRVKRDRHGDVSGETTWLARRLGLAADGPGSALSPWVHSDVLALIARDGLGVSPREVEVG